MKGLLVLILHKRLRVHVFLSDNKPAVVSKTSKLWRKKILCSACFSAIHHAVKCMVNALLTLISKTSKQMKKKRILVDSNKFYSHFDQTG
jgi:hypothetical protein